MNIKFLSAITLVAITLASCGSGGNADGANAADSTAVDANATEVTYLVDAAASQLSWKGTMLGIKHHDGTMKLSEGKFAVKGGQLMAAYCTVDMKSMVPLDTNYNKDYTKEKLLGHLASADFFAVDSFPTATINVMAATGNTATAEMTLRGRTNPETITDIVIIEENGMATATGKLVFNRQKYGVAWSSGSKDAVLSDDVEITVSIVGKKP